MSHPVGAGLAALGLGLSLLCCGSEESKMERGVVVDREEAVPGSAAEYDMTEAQRRAKEDAEEEKQEQALMDPPTERAP